MPDIKFQHVVSCSSEDPHHPATNLLKSDTYRKWRCAKVGEESASVILQLEREVQIHSIDIGNNGSAFVEVLVGNSSSPPDTPYEVLLPISSFMSPKESKDGSPANRVRMFMQSHMCPDMSKQKWDRVKVVCTQPYGKHLQYGLSFLVLHSPPEAEDSPALPSTSVTNKSPAAKLGRFTLRAEDDDDIRPGSLFAKRKEPHNEETAPKPKTAAAMIAEASSPSSLAAMETSKTKAAIIRPKKRSHSAERGSPENKRRTNGHGSSKKETDGSPERKTGEKFSKDNRKALERDTPPPESPPSPPPSPATSSTAPTKPQLRRPFKELMSDVMIVISGYQNPLRGNLRQQAAEMGAKYSADWGRGCTHLICAFPNTPKVRQVRGHGKLVKGEWIEHCHRDHKRYPWRRYAIDRQDEDGEESEEEVWEQTNLPTATARGGSGNVTTNKAPASTNQTAATSSLTKAPYDGETDDDDDVAVVEVTKKPIAAPSEVIDLDDEIYAADTDEDSDGPQLVSLPPLPDFFSGVVFLLHEDLSLNDKKQLTRYVTAFKGKVVDALDDDTNYLLTESKEGLKELAEYYPIVTPIHPKWIWACNDANKMLPIKEFVVRP